MKHYHKNPRQITSKQIQELAHDLKALGDLSGITHDLDTDEVITGNQRCEALPGIMTGLIQPEITHRFDEPTADGTAMLGYFIIDGKMYNYRAVKGWDDKKREKANVVANKRGGAWDFDILANDFELPDLLEWGFDEKELAGLDFGDNGSADAEPQVIADRFEEVAKKWETEQGQLWSCGSHFVYCGDSLDKASAEIVIRGLTPNLTIADPPYGVSIVAANGSVGGGESERGMIPFGGVKNKGLRGSDGASKPFGSKAVRGSVGAAHVVDVGKYPVIIGDENTDTAREAVTLYRELYPDTVHVWWGANYYSDILPPSMCWLVWNKETTGNFADCELAWTNQEKAARLFTHRWNGMLRDSERERRWHPTQKPAALAEWVYLELALVGGHIFDPFAGAGWSVLGAEKCGRIAHVIEKSHEYVAVTLERFSIMFPALEIKRILE